MELEICPICNKEYLLEHNGMPVVNGKVCERCNNKVVIPKRLEDASKSFVTGVRDRLYRVEFSTGGFEYFEAEEMSQALENAKLFQEDEAGWWARGQEIIGIERVD